MNVRWTAVGIVVAALIGGLYAVNLLSPAPLEKYAEEMIAACASSPYRPSCYDREIPKLMDRGVSLEDTFRVTALVQAKDSNYWFCHVLGHEVAAKETAKDPTQWTTVLARCPLGMCSNGCLHGAFQERFRNDVMPETEIEKLVPQLSTVCEQGHTRNFTDLEQASCYHALGHLTMYITGADIIASTDVCDKVVVNGEERFIRNCYDGAFMQIFQPLEPEDIALVKDVAPRTQSAAEKFCARFTGERLSACSRGSWPLYREELTAGTGLGPFCALVPDPVSLQRCYNAMFHVLTALFSFDQPKIISFCDALPAVRQAQCFANSASRFIETDYKLLPGAISLCTAADSRGMGERCYNELLFYSTFNYAVGSPGFNAICKALPDPYRTECFAGAGKTMPLPGLNDF